MTPLKLLLLPRGVGVLMEGVFTRRITHIIQDAAGTKVAKLDLKLCTFSSDAIVSLASLCGLPH